MGARTLSRDDIAFGRAVLLTTDSLGMTAEGAFWLNDGREEEWRFFLVTSLFDRIGPREIYLRLNEALAKKLSERETRSFTFFIAGPNERLVRDIRKQIQTDAHSSEPIERSLDLDGRRARALVYRLAHGLDASDAKRAQRVFRQKCSELAAA